MTTDIRFTYANDPANSDVDAVRFFVGDTDSNRPMLDDREVAFAIAQNPNLHLAAATLAEHLFGLFSAKADIKVGPVSKNFSKVAELFKKKADQLRAEAYKSALPSFPATQVSTKEALDQDTSLTRPNFVIGLGDNPFAVQINRGLDDTNFNGF